MDGHISQAVHLTTNPDELRKIADEMEKKFPLKTVGDSTLIKILSLHNGTLYIHADKSWEGWKK